MVSLRISSSVSSFCTANLPSLPMVIASETPLVLISITSPTKSKAGIIIWSHTSYCIARRSFPSQPLPSWPSYQGPTSAYYTDSLPTRPTRFRHVDSWPLLSCRARPRRRALPDAISIEHDNWSVQSPTRAPGNSWPRVMVDECRLSAREPSGCLASAGRLGKLM